MSVATCAANVLNGFDLGPLYGVDPLYVDGDGADYHLKGTSTLINAGTNAPPMGLPELDYEGNLRIANGVVDVGAYEFGSTPPTTTTTTVVTSSTTSGYALAKAPSFGASTIAAAKGETTRRTRPAGRSRRSARWSNTEATSPSAGRRRPSNCSPASVGATLRVVRDRSRTPMRSSRPRTA